MIIPRSIAGLSTTHLPWLWPLKSKRTVETSWRMDETYIKIKGKWVYLYRAVDKFGDTVDFMLSKRLDEAAATTFFKQAIDANGFPNKVVMDKSGANYAGLENINMLLILSIRLFRLNRVRKSGANWCYRPESAA